MNWPNNHADLVAKGYIYSGESTCRACRSRILFYRTPSGKRIPLNPQDFSSHFSNCPQAANFRKKKAPVKPKPQSDQERMF